MVYVGIVAGHLHRAELTNYSALPSVEINIAPVPRCKNCTAPDCAIRDEQRAYAPKACPERNH